MKKILKSIVLLCAAAPLIGFSATSGKAGQTNLLNTNLVNNPDALFSDPVIAKGKGVEVKRSQLDKEVSNAKAMFAGRGMPVPSDLEVRTLDGMIAKQLILDKATAADKAKGKQQFEEALQKIKTNAKLTDEEFNQRLQQQLLLTGQTKDQWEQQNIEQATVPVVLKREMNIKVTDEEARKFYDDNPAKFEQPEEVRAAHILLSTRDPVTGKELSDDAKAAKKKKLEDILKRARAGEDFAKLAKEYSEDPGSKDNGGVYTFARGQMDPAFEAAAFSLQTNQISDIVTTRYGYHIIKLYAKIPAHKVPFDKVTSDIKDYLTQVAISKQLQDYKEKLEKDAGVQILDKNLDEKLKAAKAAASAADAATPANAEADDK